MDDYSGISKPIDSSASTPDDYTGISEPIVSSKPFVGPVQPPKAFDPVGAVKKFANQGPLIDQVVMPFENKANEYWKQGNFPMSIASIFGEAGAIAGYPIISTLKSATDLFPAATNAVGKFFKKIDESTTNSTPYNPYPGMSGGHISTDFSAMKPEKTLSEMVPPMAKDLAMDALSFTGGLTSIPGSTAKLSTLLNKAGDAKLRTDIGMKSAVEKQIAREGNLEGKAFDDEVMNRQQQVINTLKEKDMLVPGSFNKTVSKLNKAIVAETRAVSSEPAFTPSKIVMDMMNENTPGIRYLEQIRDRAMGQGLKGDRPSFMRQGFTTQTGPNGVAQIVRSGPLEHVPVDLNGMKRFLNEVVDPDNLVPKKPPLDDLKSLKIGSGDHPPVQTIKRIYNDMVEELKSNNSARTKDLEIARDAIEEAKRPEFFPMKRVIPELAVGYGGSLALGHAAPAIGALGLTLASEGLPLVASQGRLADLLYKFGGASKQMGTLPGQLYMASQGVQSRRK